MSCGVADDDDRVPVYRLPTNRQCGKCRESSARTVYQPNVSLCVACFQMNFVNKFKTAIRRKCRLNDRRVLVAASGGLSSTTLCHALSLVTGQSPDVDISRGRIALHFDVVHIDDAAYRYKRTADDEQTQDDVVRALKALCQQCNAQLTIIPLADVFDGVTDGDRVCAALAAAPTLHSVFIRHLIAQHARAHRYRDVIFGNNATTSAVAIMTAVARGRGEDIATLAHHTADMFGVQSHYPLRDVLVRHIAYYAHWNKLDIAAAAYQALKVRERSVTVDSATADFIIRLDGLYGSTVHNIIGTTHKLKAKERRGRGVCALCSERTDDVDHFCDGCRREFDSAIRQRLLPTRIAQFEEKQSDEPSRAHDDQPVEPQNLRRAKNDRKAERQQRRLVSAQGDEDHVHGNALVDDDHHASYEYFT